MNPDPYLLNHLDDPLRFLFFTPDELLCLAGPLLAGMAVGQMLWGALCGLVLYKAIQWIKSRFEDVRLRQLAYWFLPAKTRLVKVLRAGSLSRVYRMKWSWLSAQVQLAFRQRNQAALIAAFMATSNLVLVCLVLRDPKRVVVVPAQVQTELWTDRRGVSDSYLEEMALFFCHLLLDATPSAMPYQRNIILKNVDPRAYNSLKHRLIQEETRYREENLSTHFRPTRVSVDAKKLKVQVTGHLSSFVGGKQVQQRLQGFNLAFRYEAGRLWVLSCEGQDA